MRETTSVEEKWRKLVVEGTIDSVSRRRLANVFALLPTSSRCRVCNLPFTGFSGRLMHMIGMVPSSVNPHLCNTCDVFFRMNPGGVEIRLTMLFADIRGSTTIAEKMNTSEFSKVINRFYETSTEVLCKTNALIDKLAGDQVSCYFVPGLAGPQHARIAIQAAQELLQVTGHGDPEGPWIPVGIGVHTGKAFIGSVGKAGGIVDMTALGDAVNIAARLASTAAAGEILASQETCAEAGVNISGKEHRELALKGRSLPVSVAVLNTVM